MQRRNIRNTPNLRIRTEKEARLLSKGEIANAKI